MNGPMRSALALTGLILLALTLTAAPLAAQMLPPASSAAPDGALTLMTENFEGTFPSSGWTVSDVSNDNYTHYWGRDDFRPHSGSWSAWPASGGTHAVDPASNPYPDNMNTQMRYGSFDLSNAAEAQITFWLWLDTEVDYGDSIFFGASADGAIFDQIGIWEGELNWTEVTVDLTDYLGDGSVWLRWDFLSDFSVGIMNGGAFVDDITLTKLPLDPPAVTISRSGSNITLDWPAVTNATAYEVWRGGNAPYFAPGSDCAASSTTCTVVNAPLHAYTHTGGSGSTTTNTTYVVLAVKGNARSAQSDRVGEFDFSLVRGG